MAKTALIIGASGQDGAYLARLLLGKGYKVHGASRDVGSARLGGLAILGLCDRIEMHPLQPVDARAVAALVEQVGPDEIYNLSGQSSVALSFAQPTEAIESNVLVVLNFLEALRSSGAKTRFYNAGSSEVFGDTDGVPANESTPFRPKSPYGVAKAAAISLVRNYRESYGLFACSGLLFNHELPLRPERFVTRKITAAAARIAKGDRERLRLGNLSARRDWGWAPDYVEAMWSILSLDTPADLVVASGRAHSLEEFVAAAFAQLDLDWRAHVDFDPALQRPADIACSIGDASRAAQLLGWRARTEFAGIVSRMVRGERDGAGAVS